LNQTRYVAAALCLEMHPEELATVQALLGHKPAKTMLIHDGKVSKVAMRELRTIGW